MEYGRRFVAAIGGTLMLSLVSAPLWAQGEQAGAAPRVLEEVLVTAQKREQNLMSIPGSVAALTAQTLAESSTTEFSDIGKLVSGVNIFAPPGASGPQVRIRGVGTNRFTVAIRPSISIFVDDIPQSRVETAFTYLSDLERVEILKGPQATLYGREASAGVINTITQKPVLETFEGSIQARLGTGYSQTQQYAGVINIPAGDIFATRISGYATQFENAIENIVTGKEETNDDWGARAHFLLQPIDSLRLLATYEQHQRKKRHSTPERVEYGQINLFEAAASGTALLPADPYDEKIQTTGAAGNDASFQTTALHIAWDVSDRWSLRSISGYQTSETHSDKGDLPGGNADGATSLFELFKFNGNTDDHTFSQEFRLDYTSDRLDSLIGFFYSDAELKNTNNLDIARAVPNEVNIDSVAATPTLAEGTRKVWDYGLFTNNTISLTSRFDLTVGLRYSLVEKEATSFAQAFGGEFGTFPPPTDVPTQENSWSAWSGTLKGSYHFTDDALAYLGIDRAFKAGGFNNGVTLGPQPPPPAPAEFDSEIVHSVEAGLKGFFFQRELRLGLAAFYQVYDDYQVDVQNPDGLGRVIQNAAKVEIKGVEAEFMWLATEKFVVDGSAAYIDGRFEDYVDGQCTDAQTYAWIENGGAAADCRQDLSGEQLNGQSPWTANLNGQYNGSFGTSGLYWYARAEWVYRGTRIDFPSLDERTEQEAYSLFNARFSLFSDTQGWEVALWGKNLANQEYIALYDQGRDGLFGLQARIGEGRTYGLEVRYQF